MSGITLPAEDGAAPQHGQRAASRERTRYRVRVHLPQTAWKVFAVALRMNTCTCVCNLFTRFVLRAMDSTVSAFRHAVPAEVAAIFGDRAEFSLIYCSQCKVIRKFQQQTSLLKSTQMMLSLDLRIPVFFG